MHISRAIYVCDSALVRWFGSVLKDQCLFTRVFNSLVPAALQSVKILSRRGFNWFTGVERSVSLHKGFQSHFTPKSSCPWLSFIEPKCFCRNFCDHEMEGTYGRIGCIEEYLLCLTECVAANDHA